MATFSTGGTTVGTFGTNTVVGYQTIWSTRTFTNSDATTIYDTYETAFPISTGYATETDFVVMTLETYYVSTTITTASNTLAGQQELVLAVYEAGDVQVNTNFIGAELSVTTSTSFGPLIATPIAASTTQTPTTSSTTPTPTAAPASGGLPAGAIAGIVVGVVALLLILAMASFLMVRRRMRRTAANELGENYNTHVETKAELPGNGEKDAAKPEDIGLPRAELDAKPDPYDVPAAELHANPRPVELEDYRGMSELSGEDRGHT
jgi:hypothetical protein